MKTLYPTDLPDFLRQFRFTGSRIRKIRYGISQSGEATLDVVIVAHKAMQTLNVPSEKVKLHFQFLGVEEFRFQRRPGGDQDARTACRFGSFQGMLYVDFDAYKLSPGEAAKLHDFRASDAFVGSRDLRYTILEKSKSVV